MKWTKLTKRRQPDLKREVLVWYRHWRGGGYVRVHEAGHYELVGYPHYGGDKITHWMYAPKGPKS